MTRKKGGAAADPGERAGRATRGARRREPDVRIPPHETEGSWSIGERTGSAPRVATPNENTTKKKE